MRRDRAHRLRRIAAPSRRAAHIAHCRRSETLVNASWADVRCRIGSRLARYGARPAEGGVGVTARARKRVPDAANVNATWVFRKRDGQWLRRSVVAVSLRHAETLDGGGFRNRPRSDTAGPSPTTTASWPGATSTIAGANVLQRTAVVELESQRSFGQEPGVRVFTPLGADDRLEVNGPPHPGRIDHAFDAGVADRTHVDADRAERRMTRTGHRWKSVLVHRLTVPPSSRSSRQMRGCATPRTMTSISPTVAGDREHSGPCANQTPEAQDSRSFRICRARSDGFGD